MEKPLTVMMLNEHPEWRAELRQKWYEGWLSPIHLHKSTVWTKVKFHG